MKNSLPEISVIIPLYNRGDLITETLQSLLTQTFQNWECIIVDDHSEDNGISIVNRYVQDDSRFQCLIRPEILKKGANSCRNYGLEKARGEFVYWLDSDDITHPYLLEYSLRSLKDYNVDYIRFERKLFFGQFDKGLLSLEKIKPGKRLVSSPLLIEAMLLNELEFNTCNVVWRKTSLNEEKFCENIVYADEWEYYSRLLALGLKGMNLENSLIFGRKHQKSTTAEFRLENQVRIASKIKAVNLVMNTLYENHLFTPRLRKFFLQLGFRLKAPEIIRRTLELTHANRTEKWKYELGYKFYPLLKPVFNFKNKILKI